MPKNIILLILASISSFTAVAQSDFKPGSIITTTNDTIRGLISYKKNSVNAKECIFRKSSDSESQVYKPADINGYKIENERFYIAKNVDGEKLFLEFLVDGIVNLYYYDQNGNDRFFLERDTTLIALTNDKTTLYKSTGQGYSDVKVERTSNKYKGVLTYEFRDDTKMVPKIRAATFDDKSLIKLVKQYHSDVCTDQSCIVYTKKSRIDLSITPTISWIMASMEMRGSTDHVRDAQLSYGVQIQYRPSAVFYRWSLITGAEFSKNNFNGSFFTGKFYNYWYDMNYDIQLRYNMVRIPILFQYTFPMKTIQPVIRAGINNILIYNMTYAITEEVFNPGSQTSIGSPESKMENYQIGAVIGVGLTKSIARKWSLNVKADYEYRFPSQSSGEIFDNQRVRSYILSAGLSRKLQ